MTLYDKAALKLISMREAKRKREDEVKYEQKYQSINLVLTKIYVLCFLFLYATFLPERLWVPQTDFINVLTIMTVFILCYDKTRELYKRLEDAK